MKRRKRKRKMIINYQRRIRHYDASRTLDGFEEKDNDLYYFTPANTGCRKDIQRFLIRSLVLLFPLLWTSLDGNILGSAKKYPRTRIGHGILRIAHVHRTHKVSAQVAHAKQMLWKINTTEQENRVTYNMLKRLITWDMW